jgi:hypothetical protein
MEIAGRDAFVVVAGQVEIVAKLAAVQRQGVVPRTDQTAARQVDDLQEIGPLQVRTAQIAALHARTGENRIAKHTPAEADAIEVRSLQIDAAKVQADKFVIREVRGTAAAIAAPVIPRVDSGAQKLDLFLPGHQLRFWSASARAGAILHKRA